MDAPPPAAGPDQPDAPVDPVVAIERAIAELRRSGPRARPTPGPQGHPWHGKGRHEHPFSTMARYRLLSQLDRLGSAASVTDLAAAIGVDQPRASRVVADCAARGLVERTTDPNDARRTLVTLTDAGRAVLEERRRERRAAVERSLDGFTPDERAQLAALLARFVAASREG
jgi:DNA-binding MarR family transcriptional regulator